jgi:thiol-disulfide isomerase/thioredoxin
MLRSRVTLLAAAALALGAGAGCGRSGDSAHTASTQAVPAASVVDTPQVTPASSQAVLAAVKAPGARAVLLNVWATWCVPCREEFPDLMRVGNDYRDRGLRVVLLSADFGETVSDVPGFLAQHGVDFPSYLRGGDEDDQAFVNGIDPRWSGAMPATWVFDGSGKVRAFWEGRADHARFEQAVLAVLDSTTQATEARP